jgi:hypothetical protein
MRGPLLLRETNQHVAEQGVSQTACKRADSSANAVRTRSSKPLQLGLGEFQELSERRDALVLAPGHFSAAPSPALSQAPFRSE